MDSITVKASVSLKGAVTMCRMHHVWSALVLTGILSGCAAPPALRLDLLGMPVSGTPALSSSQRTVTITADTRFVNVTSGETVRFIAGTRSFTWNFQTGATIDKFDLNLVAPPGMLTRAITVYVAPNPLYISNS
jgi:hypothetical protein